MKKITALLVVMMVLLISVPVQASGTVSEEVNEVNGRLNKSLSEALGENSLKLFDFSGSKYIRDENTINYNFLTKIQYLTLIADPEPSEEDPIKVKFIVNNVTSNMEIYLLYKCKHHSWELYETEVNGNEITVNLHSASSTSSATQETAQSSASEGDTTATQSTETIDSVVNGKGGIVSVSPARGEAGISDTYKDGSDPVAVVYREISGGQAKGTSPKTGEGNRETYLLFTAAILCGLGLILFKRDRKVG